MGATTPHRYTSQRLEADTPLYDYGARLYDPRIGTFLQPDPWHGDPLLPYTLNPHSYVLNNPIKYVDPSGEIFIQLAALGVSVGMTIYDAYQGYQTNGIPGALATLPTAGLYAAATGRDIATGAALSTGDRIMAGVSGAMDIPTAGKGNAVTSGAGTALAAVKKIDKVDVIIKETLQAAKDGIKNPVSSVSMTLKEFKEELAPAWLGNGKRTQVSPDIVRVENRTVRTDPGSLAGDHSRKVGPHAHITIQGQVGNKDESVVNMHVPLNKQ